MSEVKKKTIRIPAPSPSPAVILPSQPLTGGRWKPLFSLVSFPTFCTLTSLAYAAFQGSKPEIVIQPPSVLDSEFGFSRQAAAGGGLHALTRTVVTGWIKRSKILRRRLFRIEILLWLPPRCTNSTSATTLNTTLNIFWITRIHLRIALRSRKSCLHAIPPK